MNIDSSNDNLTKLASVQNIEILAEQILGYIQPKGNKKFTLQCLMIFEFAKVYHRLRALYSPEEGCLLEGVDLKSQQALNLSKLQEESKGHEIAMLADRTPAAAQSSKAEMLRQIEVILGVKKLASVSRSSKALRKASDGKPALEPISEEKEDEENENQDEDCDGCEIDSLTTPKYRYVKDKSMNAKIGFNSNFVQHLPRTGANIEILRTLPVTSEMKKLKSMPTRVKIGEILRTFRPVIHALAILLQGKPRFRTLLASVLVDLAVLALQAGYVGKDKVEREEFKRRKIQLLYIYFFRRPVYELITRPLIIEPLLSKLVRIDFLKNIILQAIDFRSGSFAFSL